MIAEKNKVVSLMYELTTTKNEDEPVEITTENNPLTFLFGSGMLLPSFEDAIAGKKAGESFDFIIKSDDAYGEYNAQAVVNIPISVFAIDGEIDHDLLQTGRAIPMMDQEGNRLTGIVTQVNPDSVTMDFNHPLAGADLHFKGKIIEIREATDEEIASGGILQGGCSCCGDGETCDDCN